MPDFAVSTAFTAVDRMSPVFGNMERSSGRLGNALKSGLAMAGVVGGFALVGMGIKGVIDEASKMENAVANFTPLLGGVEKANALVSKMNDLAAITPFQFEEISKSVQTLLPVMNGDIQKTIDITKMLGDTAGGNAQKMETITRGFTKAMLKGKVDMESLNMIGEAGVPIVSQLAASMGYGKNQMGQFFKVISGGGVSTDMLINTFQKMTSEGGMFYKAMDLQSKTFSGTMSTLKDNIALTAADIGMQLLPILKDFALGIIESTGSMREWVKNNKDGIATVFKTLVKLTEVLPYVIWGFAAWKLAVWGVIIAQKVQLALGWMKYLNMMWPVILKATGSTNAWGVAQYFLNGAMAANPIGLITLAIAGFIFYVGIAIKNFDTFGASMLTLLGPIGQLITFFMILRQHWDGIVEAFSSGGIMAGLKQIGIMLIDFMLMPLQQILEIASKIPGLGGLAGQGAEKIKALREGMGIKTAPNEGQTAMAGASANAKAQAEVTVKAEQGTSAQITKGAPFAVGKVGLQSGAIE